VGYDDLFQTNISLKTQSKKIITALIDFASPVNKDFLRQYLSAPPIIADLLDSERTEGAFDIHSPEGKLLSEFRRTMIDSWILGDDVCDEPEFVRIVQETESLIYHDFNMLSGYRNSGMGIGMIPLTEIKAYIDLGGSELLKMGEFSKMDLVECIRMVDSNFVTAHSAKQKRDMDDKKNEAGRKR
jgi:hypothetical protein